MSLQAPRTQSAPLAQQAPLAQEAAKHVAVRERLLAEFPDLDEETLADTLEGVTDLKEMLTAILRSILEDAALIEALSSRLADMKARHGRLEQRVEGKRALVRSVMSEAGLSQIVAPDFTASLRRGVPVLCVLAEDEIPAAYWKPQPPKLDRQGLLAALKAGVAIDGASLSAAQHQLSLRTK